MDDELLGRHLKNYGVYDTDELLRIWEEHDTHTYSDEIFGAIKQILTDRGCIIPPQTGHNVKASENAQKLPKRSKYSFTGAAIFVLLVIGIAIYFLYDSPSRQQVQQYLETKGRPPVQIRVEVALKSGLMRRNSQGRAEFFKKWVRTGKRDLEIYQDGDFEFTDYGKKYFKDYRLMARPDTISAKVIHPPETISLKILGTRWGRHDPLGGLGISDGAQVSDGKKIGRVRGGKYYAVEFEYIYRYNSLNELVRSIPDLFLEPNEVLGKLPWIGSALIEESSFAELSNKKYGEK